MKINTESRDNGRLIVNSEFADILMQNNIERAVDLWQVKSEPVKELVPERGTGKVILTSGPDRRPIEFYIKRYRPVSLRERLKNWICGKRASYDAFHEWKAIMEFHRHRLATMQPAAVAAIGSCSCILTLGIRDYARASKLLPRITGPECRQRREALIKQTAVLAGKMHRLGLAHQDFYLVHIFVLEKENDRPFLIDLQRLVMQKRLSKRWRVKDLAQLLFSASGMLSSEDIQLFWNSYLAETGAKPDNCTGLARSVYRKAVRMARRHNRKSQAANGKTIIIPDLPCIT